MASLDTNILMRYIWKDVPGQREKAIALLDNESESFYISDLVISEVVFNLESFRLRRKSIVGIIEAIISKSNVHASPFVTDEVIPFYVSHPALSFVDCYVACESKRDGFKPLWTFDRKLANQHLGAKLLQ